MTKRGYFRETMLRRAPRAIEAAVYLCVATTHTFVLAGLFVIGTIKPYWLASKQPMSLSYAMELGFYMSTILYLFAGFRLSNLLSSSWKSAVDLFLSRELATSVAFEEFLLSSAEPRRILIRYSRRLIVMAGIATTISAAMCIGINLSRLGANSGKGYVVLVMIATLIPVGLMAHLNSRMTEHALANDDFK